MKKEAVLHIPLSQYAYAAGEHEAVLRLRCAKDDVGRCTVCFGDRVDQKPVMRVKEKEMQKTASDDLFDYYEVFLNGIYPRFCYYFRLEDGGETLYYYERGFCEKIGTNRTEYFQFPYIRREDIITPPKWARDAVMYQIFPDSFATGKKEMKAGEKAAAVRENGAEILSRGRLGGTLRGIMENLSYLAELGVSCVYLNPVFLANSYHKYDTADYFRVDACFGDGDDLKELVKKCHKSGVRVLLDGVFNHCGPDFFAFRDVLLRGKKSRYYDWFYAMPEVVRYADPPEYAAFAYVKEMPKLNTSNRELERYLIDVGTYWIKEADIDGWRLDVANEVNHDFWRHFRSAILRVKPDAFLIGEIWEDAGAWLLGDQFDSTMNYRFCYLCRDFFAERAMDAAEFDAQIQKMIFRYPAQISLVQMNFLDTHDVPRFLSYCGGDIRRFRLAYFYLFTGCGIPSVFYGDERGVTGVTEEEYRRAMPWDGGDEELTAFFRECIALRKSHSALRDGSYRTLLCDGGFYVFLREDETEKIVVLVNNSDGERLLDSAFWRGVETQIGEVADKIERLAAMEGAVARAADN